MKTPDEIKKGLEYLSITSIEEKLKRAKQIAITYAYNEEIAANAIEYIRQLEAAATWHPFPEERPSDGALVWVHAPSTMLYWSRYNYAEYRHGTFWRGAERIDNVVEWMSVREADHAQSN